MREIAISFAYTIGVGLGILFFLGLTGVLAVLLWRLVKYLGEG